MYITSYFIIYVFIISVMGEYLKILNISYKTCWPWTLRNVWQHQKWWNIYILLLLNGNVLLHNAKAKCATSDIIFNWVKLVSIS